MDHLIPWLTLKSVPGIGNLLFRRLVVHFGSPAAVLSAAPVQLAAVAGITDLLAKAISRQKTPDWVPAELESVKSHGYSLITQHDAEYPRLLLEIPDPPPVLYISGRLPVAAASIAVVGSRKASSYGLTTTHRLCKGLAANGIVVVSGMARGIDTAAHRGALAGNGLTLAVLGSGLGCVYPVENRDLFDRISKSGAVITEFGLDTRPEPHHFPMRNRIISGLCLGVVVVEAARRSGSLITARLAAEQGREVFAVPGSIHAATAQGTHHLIQQGAKLIRGVEDIIAEIGPQIDPAAMALPHNRNRRAPQSCRRPQMTPAESEIFEALGAYGVHIDQLARQLGMEMSVLAGTLVQLELKGIVCQEPGNHYVRHVDYLELEC